MTCPVCHGTGYTVIPWDPRNRKNPGRDEPQEARLPCILCNATGALPDPA